jgi:mannosyl-oligosaccharide alpha-1,3-glucosidase
VVVNAPKAWRDKKKVVVMQADEVSKADVTFHQGEKGHASWAVVRDPKVVIVSDWSISFA